MKNLIFVLLIITIFTSCSKSQDNILKDWSAIQYHYSRGPLPPPYHYSFQITINKDGASILSYHLGYDDNYPSLDYNFTVSPDNLLLLEEKICISKLASGKIEKVPENQHPVGGSLNNVKLIITDPNPNLDKPPTVIESPYFPKEEYKKGLVELYDFIEKLVPDEVWLDVAGKKVEYETNYKK